MKASKFNKRKPLTNEELLDLIENGLSDIEFLSDDDDEVEGVGADIFDESEDEGLEVGQMASEPLSEEVDETIVEMDPDTEVAALEGNIDVPMYDATEQMELPRERKQKEKKEKEARIEVFMKNNNLTKKTDIIWIKDATYISPNVDWYEKNIPCDSDELESPYYFFEKYFSDALFSLIIENTNLFALQQQTKFAPTNIDEIKTFVGIHIVMGNCHFPRIRCYWQPNCSIPIISNSMPINRFFKLRQHTHFVNVEEKPDNNDRLWKIRPLYDAIRQRCLSLPLETDLCIDEQMIPFKGSLNIKQYIKNKPTKWGIKVLALCGRSGILYDFVIYQGVTTEFIPEHIEVFGSSGAIVTTLAQRIINPNVRLYFDNFFSNYNVLQYLRNKSIYAYCTARIDRFKSPPFSSDKIMKKKRRGSFEEVISKDGIIMTKWFDNKSVILASNYRGVGMPDTCVRWDKSEKQYKDVPRPEVVKEYNDCMGGVDKLDFLITLYRTFIRSRKWTMRMFTHAIDIACANAWLEYKEQASRLGISKKDVLDLLGFRAYVAEVLIKANKTPARKKGRPSSATSNPPSPAPPSPSTSRATEIRPVSEIQFDQLGHFPNFDSKKFASRCKNLDCKGQTRVICIKCQVHLCLNKEKNCFLSFHVK